jgi:hypothetical protein
MTLEERLALAREIAARSTPRFVVDTTREEMRQKQFEEIKRRTEALNHHGQSDPPDGPRRHRQGPSPSGAPGGRAGHCIASSRAKTASAE